MTAHRRRPAPAGLLAVLALAAALGAAGCDSKRSSDTCGPRACVTDQDCGLGFWCGGQGQRVCNRLGWFCATPSVSMNDRGEWFDCDVYRCDAGGTGQCLRTANGTGDCANGAFWDAISYTCVCPVGTPCGGSAAPPAYDLSCYATCARDADCKAGEMCWTPSTGPARCVPADSYCARTANGVVSIYPSGPLDGTGNMPRTVTGCGNYQCNPVTGTCLTDCTNTGDCAPGKGCVTCDPVNTCTPPWQVCQ